MHFTQFEVRPQAGGIGEFGEGIGQTASAHVMNGEDGVVGTLLPAGVDDFLTTALDFRVAALDGCEVEIGRVGAGGH
jgi:hypothetical protein